MSSRVDIKAATSECESILEENGYAGFFGPCANFRHEVDRVDYTRYLLTGYIFEETEESLTTGNRTMYAIPQSLRCSKVAIENFYYTLDINRSDMIYTKSLKRSTDRLMIHQMVKLKEMVDKDQLRMSFEQAKMSKGNKDLISRIKQMKPCTVDWSNLADFCTKEDFLAMAKGVSGEETLHYMHLMNWTQRVPGTKLEDHGEIVIESTIRESQSKVNSDHRSSLCSSSTYR